MPDSKNDRLDPGEFLLRAESDLGKAMAFLDMKSGRIVRANAAFAATFGYNEQELAAFPSFAALVPTENQLSVRDHIRTVASRPTFETTAIGRGGRRIWMEVSLRPLKIGEETLIVVLVADITRRREVEEQVLLLETITLAVNDAPDFPTALNVVLRKVCVATGWEYGLAWVPSPDRKFLRVSAGSYGAGGGNERFRNAMSEIEIAMGDDLPGRAWTLRQPQWVDDIALLRSFRRQTILREFGIHIAMAIPILAKNQVAAVLEFCVSERHAHSKDVFVGLASAIAPQLGSLVQRKKAEDERDRFFNLSPDLMCVVGFDDYFKRINPAFERLLGYTTPELMSRPVSEFIHPDDRHRTLDLGADLKKIGQTNTFENRYIAKDGSTKWVSWAATVDVEDPEMVYAIGRDITSKKENEEETRQSREFLDQVIENIPDMIFIKDAKDLRFVRFNKAGEELLGMKRDMLIGRNDYDFFPKEEAEGFIAKDRQVLSGGKVVEIPEEPIHTKNGIRTLHTKKIPLLGKDGKPLYLLGISEDITDRKKT